MLEKLLESLDKEVYTAEMLESIQTQFNEAVETRAEEIASEKVTKVLEEALAEKDKEMETKILNANERAINLEYELFVEIRNEIKPYTSSLQTLCNDIALIDVYNSLSEVALQNDYVKPVISSDRNVEIVYY